MYNYHVNEILKRKCNFKYMQKKLIRYTLGYNPTWEQKPKKV